MSRQRFTLLLIAAVIAISAALVLSARRNQPQDAPGVVLYPGLTAELNSVTTVLLRKGSATPSATLHKTKDQWTLAERADYPVDVGKLRKLLMSLGDAKIVEEKTADPQRFASIGVEDPGAAGAAGAEVSVLTATDKHTLIVGKSVGEGNFVRRAGENQSYSVEPAISVETEPRFWIEPKLLDIASSLIEGLDVKPAGGPGYVLHRAKLPPITPPAGSAATPASGSATSTSAQAPGSTATTAASAPGSAAPASGSTTPAAASAPGSSTTTAASATVSPRATPTDGSNPPPPASGAKSPAAAATRAPGSPPNGAAPDARLSSDNTFTLDGVPAGRKALDGVSLAPSPGMLSSLTVDDVAPANSIDFGQSSQAVITLTDGGVVTITGTVAGDKHWIQVKSTKDAALTAKATGRAFEIASYRYDGIFKPLEQWLVPKPSPPAKTPAAAPPAKIGAARKASAPPANQ